MQSFAMDNGKLWVKQALPQTPTLWHWIQAGLSGIIPLKILRRTAGLNGAGGLEDEAARLQRLLQAGFCVPAVYDVTPDYIVLSDAGIELKALLDRTAEPASRWPYLIAAAEALGELHAAGFIHGRPHLKDFVYQAENDRVGFVDLEEDPLKVMPREQARARDIWLFLGSAARFLKDDPARLDDLYRHYCEKAGHSHERQLRRFVMILRPLRWILQHTIARSIGKDVQQAILANDRLEKILL